jgi:hypothetical protein
MARRSSSDAIVVAGAAASAARVLRKDFSAKIISRVGSTALRRGMHSGSRGWLYVAAAASGARMLHKYAGRKEEVLSIKLLPGESLQIREIRRAK